MNFARHLTTCTLALLAAAGATGQTESKPPIDPARWVPKDALAYVGVADIRKLGDEFRQTAFYRMTQDPNAKEPRGHVSAALRVYEELKNRLARSLETEPDKLENPFAGPLALYATAARDDPADGIEVVFVAGVGDAELTRDYYDRAIRKFRAITDNHGQVSFGAHTIDWFATRTRQDHAADEDEERLDQLDFDADQQRFGSALDETLADAMSRELALCLTPDRLIVASTREHVEDVLRREQPGDSLVETEAYQVLRREFNPLGSLRFLVNLPLLFEMMEAVEGREAREALAMLGAESMKGLVGHVLHDGREFESKLEALLLLRGERTGLAKMLSMKNRPVTPPASVSANSLIYASVQVNVTEVLDEIERMIRHDDPDVAGQMRANLESLKLAEDQTLNLRTDVLENLRQPLTFTMGFRRPYAPHSASLLLTLGHRDRAASAGFLEKLSMTLPGMMIERELEGTPVYDIPLVGFSLAPADAAVVAGTTNAVDAALRSPAGEHNSLAADPRFRRATALAPREAWGVFYVDSRRIFEAALEMAEGKDTLVAAQLANPASLIALRIMESFTMGVDPDRIDAARQLSRHLAPCIITVATRPDGIRLTRIDLVPEGE